MNRRRREYQAAEPRHSATREDNRFHLESMSSRAERGTSHSWLVTRSAKEIPTSTARSLAVCAARDDSKGNLENDHGVSNAHEIFHARGVPVRKANATVTRGAANSLGIVCAMNANTRLV